MRRRLGGHIAHYGVFLAVIALAVSRGYRTETELHLAKGETQTFEQYQITFDGSKLEKQAQRDSVVSTFTVVDGGSPLPLLQPRFNFYPTQREPVVTPAVHSTPFKDVYLNVVALPRDGGTINVRVIERPYMLWLWLAAAVIALGSIIAMWPSMARKTADAKVPA